MTSRPETRYTYPMDPSTSESLETCFRAMEKTAEQGRFNETATRRHFDSALAQKGVDILDPCTGTGIFIHALMEHFAYDQEVLRYKYANANELHANEVDLLPYYIGNPPYNGNLTFTGNGIIILGTSKK